MLAVVGWRGAETLGLALGTLASAGPTWLTAAPFAVCRSIPRNPKLASAMREMCCFSLVGFSPSGRLKIVPLYSLPP